MAEQDLGGLSVAYVLIKTELGAANDVATMVSQITGVFFTSVITGPYDVIAAVCVSDNASLGTLVVDQIQNVTGVKNPSTQVVSAHNLGPGREGRSWFP